MTIGKAKVDVEFDKAKIGRDAADAITPAIEGAAKSGAQLLAGALASKALIGAAKDGFGELIESQKVSAQSMVALRGEANITAADIDDLGQSMLDLAGFDDEAARSAANVLLRFGAIHDAGTLKRVETDAADLAVTMGTDLPAAAQTLGQILQDPENAARKLRPIIGSLTDTQKESIKAFTDQGDAAGAQSVILQILEERIGGAAKAYGDTLGGSLDKAKQNIENAKASLVEGLAPALETGSELVSSLAQGIESLPGPLREIASVTVGTTTAIVGLAQPISGLISSFNALKSARLLSAAAADVDTTATLTEAEAQGTLAASSTAAATKITASKTAGSGLLAVLGPVGAAIGATAIAYDVLGDAAEPFTGAYGLFHGISRGSDDAKNALSAMIPVVGLADQAFGVLGDGDIHLANDHDVLAEAVQKTVEKFPNLQAAAKDTSGLDAQTTAADSLKASLQAVQDSADLIGGAPNADIAAQRAGIAHERAISRQTAAQDKLNEAQKSGDAGAISAAQADLAGANIDVTSSALDQAEAYGKLADAADGLAGRQVTVASQAQNVVDALKSMSSELAEDPNFQLYVGELQRAADLQGQIIRQQSEANNSLNSGGQLVHGDGNTTHRAAGGPLAAGQASWVGELGPEIFVPQIAGSVVPHSAVSQAFSGNGTPLGSGVTINGNINVYGGDARSALRNLPAEMNAARHLAGV